MPLFDAYGRPILGALEESTRSMLLAAEKILMNFGEAPYMLKDFEANQRVRDLYASCGAEPPQAQKFMKFRRYNQIKK